MIRASSALPSDIAQRSSPTAGPTDQRWVNATLQAGNPHAPHAATPTTGVPTTSPTDPTTPTTGHTP